VPPTRRTTRAWLYAGVAGLLAVITWIDYATGYELELFVFYFIPVGLAAWYGSRVAGLVLAAASAACWYLADRLSHHPYSNSLFIYWETFMRLVAYVTTALTLSSIRERIQERESLLHVVSHDLRAPLDAVVGQARLLLRRGADAWTSARVDAILRAASRMDSMIGDLLDAARLESGRLRLELEEVELGPYLGELLPRMGAALDVERVDVALPASERIVVRADPGRLERVLLNLLSNALKYSPEGRVRLEVASRGEWVSICVVDRGPGIRPEDLPHLFQRFYRGRGSPSADGIGLGLYGSRLLVEAHGGRIGVESAPGAETRFRVELPAVSAGRATQEPPGRPAP